MYRALINPSFRRSFSSSSQRLSQNPFLASQEGQNGGEITDAHLSFLNGVLLPSTSVRTNNKKGRKEAGVLLPLCNHEGEAAILFTKRTDTVGSHKGQVCFPGGKFDDEDGDIIYTSLRETDEELGLCRSIPQVLGVLPPAMSVTQLWVTTVVGYLGDSSQLKFHPNEHEIEAYFFLKLSELTDPEKQDEQILSYPSLSSKHPAQFRSKRYLAGEWPVWGLTAHFVTEFLKILHPDSVSSASPPSTSTTTSSASTSP